MRKPTLVVLVVAVLLAGLYLFARHDLKQSCPAMLKGQVPVFTEDAGNADIDDGVTPETCTDQDPAYLDMQQYQYLLEMCGVVLLATLLLDVLAYKMSESRKLQHRRDRAARASRKLLVRISRFLGGL